MAIAYPLSLPAVPAPQAIEISSSDIVGINVSPFTGQQEIYDWGADMWAAKVTWNRIVARAKAEPLLAVITALRGPVGTVLVGDPLGRSPRGSAGGTPLVNGAVAIGARQLPVRGLPLSTAGWLKAGDYLQIGSGASTRLYKALADIDTDGSGNAIVDIWPQVRDGYADGAPITLDNCVGTFRLAAPTRQWQIASGLVYATALDLMEAL